MADRRPIPFVASHHGRAQSRQSAVPFGDLLRQFRVAAGLTQEELAARSTVSVRTISDLERKLRNRPQRETLRLLTDALGLHDDDWQHFEAAARSRPDTSPRLIPRDAAPNNLPIPITPLVGRDGDRAAIAALLSMPATRLITVTGVGGVGKTRLVMDVAYATQALFPDGVKFVSLAAIREPALVLTTIAQAFGLTERGTRGLRAALIAHLDRQRSLLVLDNFEQVIPAAVLVADLLAACGGLTVVVTSRAALHVRGEHEYRLSPLTLPDLETDDVAQVVRSPAVELFLQRATAINRDFALEPANARDIARICTRLDGIPLALELAAARTRVLQPAELLARLEHRFAVLTDGASDLPTRQQTMRHTIDWSYDLLPVDEQQLFRQLAVFAGGCTLDAAEGLVGAVRGEPANLLSGLASLVEKSLLQTVAHGGATRFTMLETVREYGLERLTAAGEIEAAQGAHAAWYLAVATAEDFNAVGEAHARWLARMDTEHDNFRAALAWARGRGEAAIGMRLVAALWDFWFMRGFFREGRAWLETMVTLDRAHPVSIEMRGVVLRGIATLALRQGDLAAATTAAEQSLACYRETADEQGIASALTILGSAAFERNDYDGAIAHHTRSLAFARDIGNRRGIAVALHNLGRAERFMGNYERASAYYQQSEAIDREMGAIEQLARVLGNQGHMARDRGDLASARPLIENSLALYQQMGEKRGTGIALAQMAMIACDNGDLATARGYAERSMAIRRQIDDRWGIAQSNVVFGDIARSMDNRTRAWACYRDGLMTYAEIGNRLGVAECLERLACLMARGLAWTDAARWFGAASAVREQIRAPILPIDGPIIERAIANTRAALGEGVWVAAHDSGRSADFPVLVTEIVSRSAPFRE